MSHAALNGPVGTSEFRAALFVSELENATGETSATPAFETVGMTVSAFGTGVFSDSLPVQKRPSNSQVRYGATWGKVENIFSVEIPSADFHATIQDSPVGGFITGTGKTMVRSTYKAAVETVNQVYVLEGRDEVERFIGQNRLRHWLEQAVEPLNKSFGKSAIKILQLNTDDEGAQTLFCLVKVTESLDQSRRSLASFDRQWWSEHCGPVAGKLNFDFELV